MSDDAYCSFCGQSTDHAPGEDPDAVRPFICAECTEAFRDVQQATHPAPPLPTPFAEGPGTARPQRLLPLAVIPARFASTRFPGKPLALLAGKPMIWHVWDACRRSGAFSGVFVATDDKRIAREVKAFGGKVVLTSPDAPSGTDRVAEVSRALPFAEALVNVQGDEPLVSVDALRTLAGAFSDPDVQMATLARPLAPEEAQNPNVVKVVRARNGDALYFSRQLLPFQRDPAEPPPPRFAHVGLYAYRRDTLQRLATLAPTPLEQAEKLEQLRALEHGIPIRCLLTDHVGIGVDTPADLSRAEALLLASAQKR